MPTLFKLFGCRLSGPKLEEVFQKDLRNHRFTQKPF